MVSVTVHAGVVGVIERIHDPVFDQRTDGVGPEFIGEGFRVVASVGGKTPQGADVPAGDLESLLLAPFERGDVVGDFSEFAGETFTVTNDAEFPFEAETAGSDQPICLTVPVMNYNVRMSGRRTPSHVSNGGPFRGQGPQSNGHIPRQSNQNGFTTSYCTVR